MGEQLNQQISARDFIFFKFFLLLTSSKLYILNMMWSNGIRVEY